MSNNYDDERIQAVMKGRRAVRRLPMPGMPDDAETVPEIGVRILIESEVDEARADAVRYLQNLASGRQLKAEDLMDAEPHLLMREMQRQIIWRAMIDPDTAGERNPKPFFMAPQTLRQLDTVMVETLHQVYLDHQQYVNPLRTMDAVDAEELADALGKSTGITDELRAWSLLAQYDAPTLRSLLRFMAVQLSNSRAGK